MGDLNELPQKQALCSSSLFGGVFVYHWQTTTYLWVALKEALVLVGAHDPLHFTIISSIAMAFFETFLYYRRHWLQLLQPFGFIRQVAISRWRNM